MIAKIPPDTIAKARALRAKGASTPKIAENLGIGKSAAHALTADMGVDSRAAANKARAAKPPPWLQRARKMLAAGVSRNEIAQKLGVAKSSVYRMLAKFGV